MAVNGDRDTAKRAVQKINEYWEGRVDLNIYEPVQAEYHPGSYVIKSNLVNGLPVKRRAKERGI